MAIRNRLLSVYNPNNDREGDRTSLQESGPESQLLAAIIERAILDLRGIDFTKGDEARTALAWIDNNETTAPFSFLWVCQELNLDPGRIRKLAQQVFDGEIIIDGFYGRRRVPRPHGLKYTKASKEDIAAEMNRKLILRRDACEANRLKSKTDS